MAADLKRYSLIFVLTIVGLFGLSYALEAMGLHLPSGFSSIAPAMIAAQIEGARLGSTYARPFERREAWVLALPMTLCGIAINLALLVAYIFQLTGDQAMELLDMLGVTAWVVVFVLMGGVIYLTNRIFLGLGLRMQLRAMQRQSSGE
ncbi:MAG: ABZJ_00895 family protein [Pelagimonas sp.]|jgi:hypothetical protein|nr:ABZJ_00895 family protein [Pelagimonas sp.]